MPIVHNGIRVNTLKEFKSVYEVKHQDKIPVEKVIEKRQPESAFYVSLVIAFIIFALNVMSGAHTIPTITKFYEIDSSQTLLLGFIGIMGFIGIEGIIIFLMSLDRRGYLVWAVVAMALLFSTVVNIVGSTVGVQHNKTVLGMDVNILLSIGFLAGVFVPFANAAMGEVLHRQSLMRRKELHLIKQEYQAAKAEEEKRFLEAKSDFETNLQKAYKAYLKKLGLGDEQHFLDMVSGIAEAEYEASTMATVEEVPTPVVVTPAVIVDDAETFWRNNPGMSGKEIAEHFGKSAAWASQLRNKIKSKNSEENNG